MGRCILQLLQYGGTADVFGKEKQESPAAGPVFEQKRLSLKIVPMMRKKRLAHFLKGTAFFLTEGLPSLLPAARHHETGSC